MASGAEGTSNLYDSNLGLSKSREGVKDNLSPDGGGIDMAKRRGQQRDGRRATCVSRCLGLVHRSRRAEMVKGMRCLLAVSAKLVAALLKLELTPSPFPSRAPHIPPQDE